MKFVVLTLAFVFSFSVAAFAAVPAKWSESRVKDLNSKTLREAFCTKNIGYQAQAGCDYLKKNKVNLNQKVTSARAAGSSLFLVSGKSEIEIKQTAKPTQFEINRKVIDLKNYREPAALAEAIRKMLPKVAGRSLWMNVAVADDDTTFEAMRAASLLMLQSTFDDRWCGYAERFIQVCNTNLSESATKYQWDTITAKVKNKQPLNSDDWRWLESDAAELRFRAKQMSALVTDLNKPEVQNSLKRCPSSNNPALANAQEDVLKCDKILTLKTIMAQEIPGHVETEQTHLKANLKEDWQIKLADQFRKELVEWMEYLTTNEEKAKAPSTQNNVQ